ncbi:MAG: diguanylate cyclase [Leptolyngbyaceae cyanobacterium]
MLHSRDFADSASGWRLSSETTPPDTSALVKFLPLFEHLHEGVQIFAVDGTLIYANPLAIAHLGATSLEDLQADNGQTAGPWPGFQDLTGQELAMEAHPCIQALQGETVAEQSLVYVDPQQLTHRLAIRAFPLRDEAGQIQFAAVLSHELSPLKPPSPGLEPAVQAVQQIAAVIPSLVACLDLQERHLFANQAYLSTFNHTADSIQGVDLQTVLGPVGYQQLRDPLQQACKGHAAGLCLRLHKVKTLARYQQISIIPRLKNSQVKGFFLVLSDVAAHRHTNGLLQHENHFLQYSLEAASMGTWDWDFVNHTLIWSAIQEQLFGLSPGSFDSQPETFMNLVNDRDRESVSNAVNWAMQPQQLFIAEFRIFHADGTTRWLSQRGQVLRDDQGQVIRMVGVTFDITAQHEAQMQLMHQINRERLIAKVSQDISQSDQLAGVLGEALEAVRQHLAVDRVAIVNLRQAPSGIVTDEAYGDGVESMLEWKMRHPWSLKASYLKKFKLGHPLAVTNVQEQSLDESELGFLEFFNIAADLSIPLLEDNKLWGILSAQCQQPRTWQLDEQRLLQTVGTLVSTAVERDRLTRNLTRANHKLQRFAYLDGLTRVANRRRFEEFLNQEWRRLMREQAPMALIMGDIDHFKAYNDVYGHQAGDDCLRRVAGILRSSIQRPADMVARYGGEEFVMVLPNTDVEGAETVAKKVKSLLHSKRIPHIQSSVADFVTMSLGIAVMRPHPLKSPDDLVKLADRALYKAKQAGRDRIACHNSNKRS